MRVLPRIALDARLVTMLFGVALALLLIGAAEVAPLGDVKRWGPPGYLVLIAGAAVAEAIAGSRRGAILFGALFVVNVLFYAAFQAGAFGPSFEILAIERLLLFASAVASAADLARRIRGAGTTPGTFALSLVVAVIAAVAVVTALGIPAELSRAGGRFIF